jgi:hypothetical protein
VGLMLGISANAWGQYSTLGFTFHLNIFWDIQVLTDWNQMSYEYTQPIGMLSPGTYTLEVQYMGVLYASSSIRFTVLKPVSERPGSSFPWSWFEDMPPH